MIVDWSLVTACWYVVMLFWSVTHELWAVVNEALIPVDVPAEFVATS